MFNIVKKSVEWAGKDLIFETGEIARQAGGAVKVTYGETVVLCTAVSQKEVKEGADFFPLTVNYQEKTFAAGKIPGGFFKREGRPTEKETLTSRLIDRPIRPLFPEGFYNETQVICTVISHDLQNDPDIVSLVGASAALAISGVPFQGPLAGARVAYKEGNYILNPTAEELVDTELDLVVAGTETSVLMVESEAKILSEETMLGAVEFGHKGMQPVIELIKELKSEAGKEDWEVKDEDYSELEKKIGALAEKGLRAAYKKTDKQERVEAISVIKDSTKEQLLDELEEEEYDDLLISKLLKNLEKDIVRGDILKTKKRIDSRGVADVRSIETSVSFLPKVHGAALFTRGETQALVATTLGTGRDVQIIDALEGEYQENFMLHYNFPPYSVGEASFMRGPGRREIGHGKLAWRSLRAVLPSKEDFYYTIRVVSEVTESNGSSSMATVCGSSLSMMDAGVPLKAPVAGIAMGLIKEGDDYVVLSDILGDEDHLGDMDFKVAGTAEGVTALQMDIKINGITTEIMQKALDQAKGGRMYILDEMANTITQSREEINANAPKIVTISIDKSKIGELIGPGGKVIRDITEKSGATIDIEDDGTVHVAANNKESSDIAMAMVNDILAEVEVGKIYEGPVVRILDFGAFVNFLGKNDGLVHISELCDERVDAVTDIVSEGDIVKVKVVGFDKGKVRLSMKSVNQETGEDIGGDLPSPKKSGGDKRGDRKPNRKPRGNGDSKRGDNKGKKKNFF